MPLAIVRWRRRGEENLMAERIDLIDGNWIGPFSYSPSASSNRTENSRKSRAAPGSISRSHRGVIGKAMVNLAWTTALWTLDFLQERVDLFQGIYHDARKTEASFGVSKRRFYYYKWSRPNLFVEREKKKGAITRFSPHVSSALYYRNLRTVKRV
jgi:hypothetical protein